MSRRAMEKVGYRIGLGVGLVEGEITVVGSNNFAPSIVPRTGALRGGVGEMIQRCIDTRRNEKKRENQKAKEFGKAVHVS